MLQLVIGNYNYSSWSLRAWLFLRESGLQFELRQIPMFTDSWADEVRQLSPARRVPVLIDGPHRVWDSLAIVEHLLENHAPAVGWPTDPAARAEARSVTAEMHSGFIALRSELPQNIRARRPLPRDKLSPDCQRQMERVFEIWRQARERHGDHGPWLFGGFSIADVFYTPVALRFVTYAIPLPEVAQEFVATVQALPSVREWCQAAADEQESIDFIDRLMPVSQAPLTIG